MNQPERVDVVLDVVAQEDGSWRVFCAGVLPPDAPEPPRPQGEHYRNRVQTWIGVEHRVSAFRVPAGDSADGEATT